MICTLSGLLFNIDLKVLASAIIEEKEVKGINCKRKSKNMPDDMMLYIENLKDDTRKLLELISEFKLWDTKLIH